MPRKSAAALATPAIGGQPVLRPRQDAPEAVQRLFREVVALAPAGHFQAADGFLLERYAAALLLARQASAELEAGGAVMDGKPSPWLTVLEKADRAVVALSGRLRLAPQARDTSRSAGRKTDGLRPSAYDVYLGQHDEGL
jgi:phage terminase small subunit